MPKQTVSLRFVIHYSKFKSYITENTLYFQSKNNWLILLREIFAVYFKKLTKQINTMSAKKRGYFIYKLVAYTVNSGFESLV